jgi:hypothetical protein
MVKTCLNRLIGGCKNICQSDYDISHHPNNYDCKDYHEIPILEFTVVKVSLWEKVYMEIGKIFGKDGELSKKILEQKAKELERV